MEAAIVSNQKPHRVRRSWELVKSSWHVLKLDKELLTLPLIGMLLSLAVAIAAGILYGLTILLHWGNLTITQGSNGTESTAHWGWTGAVILALLLIGVTFVSNFIAVAIAKGALDRFSGQDPTIKSSLRAAKARSASIFKWSLLSLTVGLILQTIQERVPFAAKILVWLGEMVWGVATFFVVPIIAVSEKPVGPIQATKESTSIIKRVWGESLIVNLGVGLIALLSMLVYIPLAIIISFLASTVSVPLAIALGILAFLGFFVLILVFNVLGAIAKAAVYYWATTDKAPENFDKELLRASLTDRKARKIFALR
ncbi:MAG TPA: DUF6159 family protein [Candidatus Saccharimonadales bacterium]|nr:DUF6159 family protein [Candidatus Saccharimonadales bacterium]